MSRSVLGVVVLSLLAASSQEKAPSTVELVCDPWPPYVLGELGSQAQGGPGVELMKVIFDRLDGAELSIPLVPWNRALREVRTGARDGIGLLLKTAEREEYMEYTEEVFRSHDLVWFSNQTFPEGFTWESSEDLHEYQIGVVRGQSYGQEIDKLIATGSSNVVQVASTKHAFNMLVRGRIDLAIADQRVGASLVASLPEARDVLQPASKPMADEIFFIAFSKKSNERRLIPRINQILKDMQAEGVIERLLAPDTQDQTN